MTRAYLTFGDIEGKLEMLRVECTRCQRKGRVAKLIEKYGRSGNMMKWREQLERAPPRLWNSRIGGVGATFAQVFVRPTQ